MSLVASLHPGRRGDNLRLGGLIWFILRLPVGVSLNPNLPKTAVRSINLENLLDPRTHSFEQTHNQ